MCLLSLLTSDFAQAGCEIFEVFVCIMFTFSGVQFEIWWQWLIATNAYASEKKIVRV